MKKQVQLLAARGYTGSFSFEWEKAWHPDLEEPEVAIADYAKVVSGYLKKLVCYSDKARRGICFPG